MNIVFLIFAVVLVIVLISTIDTLTEYRYEIEVLNNRLSELNHRVNMVEDDCKPCSSETTSKRLVE